MKRNKSAKDIAFEKERAKFRHEINNAQKIILDKEDSIKSFLEILHEKDLEIERLNDWIERLLEYTELSEEDMKCIIKKDKEKSEIMEKMKLLFDFDLMI